MTAAVLFAQRPGNGFDVAVGNEDVVGHERVEALAVLGLARGRGGADRPAVKALLRRDDVHPARDLPGQLDHGIVCLGAAAGKRPASGSRGGSR